MSDLETTINERALSRVGQVLRGKWHLDRLIGVGGMACVYAATHRNGKRGAVKLLHPELALSSGARSRFLREGYVANKVGHPGAVSVLDDDVTEDDCVFLVMELLEGSTVEALAESRPDHRLEPREVLSIADQLLDILALAHENGIVHRDLKPENLFLATKGSVHVLDFGIARLRQAGSSVTATRTGDSMGTPVFMPPEQALGDWDSVDGRSDLWAVGATMFTLLSGRFVHEADTVQKTMLAAMTKPAPPLGTVLENAPRDIAEIVDTALAMKREDRFSDARAMQTRVKAALARIGAGEVLAPLATASEADPHEKTMLSSSSDNADLRPAAGPQMPLQARSNDAYVLTAAPVSSDKHAVPVRKRPTWIVATLLVMVGFIGVLALGIRFMQTKTASVSPSTVPGSTSPVGNVDSAQATASERGSKPERSSVTPGADLTSAAAPPSAAAPAADRTAPPVIPTPPSPAIRPQPQPSAHPTPSAPPPTAAPTPTPATTFHGRF